MWCSMTPAGTLLTPLARSNLSTKQSALEHKTAEAEAEAESPIPSASSRDRQALEVVVREHLPRLLEVVRGIVRDEEAARDCLQSAFAKAFSKSDQFRGDAAMETWLHRIVVNEGLMHLRRNKKRAETSIDDMLPQFDSAECRIDYSLGLAQRSPAEILASKEARIQVRAAIDALPESYRTVVLLRDIEGLSTADAAAMLDISATNVKVRLHRARCALKAALLPLMIGDELS